MGNILSSIKYYLSINEISIFLVGGIILAIGILLNFALFLFVKNKNEIKKYSDKLSNSILGVNAVLFGFAFIYINNPVGILNDNIYFSKTAVFLIFISNLFLLLFGLSFSRLLKKARHKAAVVNGYLLNISLFSGVFFILNNPLCAFIALDIVVWSIYKYACEMKILKKKVYAAGFLAVSLLSGGLYYAFYLFNSILNDSRIKTIVGICLVCAVLLKIGIFPIYNYLRSKSLKTNIPCCVLLLCYLPFLGVGYFSRFAVLLDLKNEVFKLTLESFLLIFVLTSAIIAFRSSNVIKIFANIYYIFSALCIMNVILPSFDGKGLTLSIYALFGALGIYSLLAILKINSNAGSINLPLLKGLNKNNSLWSFVFVVLTSECSGILPGAISFGALGVIKNIYMFDKAEIVSVFIMLCAYIITVFAVLRTIHNIYAVNKTNEIYLTKRTTLNYVVPIVIIIFLVSGMFLQIFDFLSAGF